MLSNVDSCSRRDAALTLRPCVPLEKAAQQTRRGGSKCAHTFCGDRVEDFALQCGPVHALDVFRPVQEALHDAGEARSGSMQKAAVGVVRRCTDATKGSRQIRMSVCDCTCHRVYRVLPSVPGPV